MLVIVLSIIIQFITAGYSIWLIRLTKERVSWICVSLALILMSVRRVYNLYIFTLNDGPALNPGFELIGLILSVLMFFGVIGLGRILIEREKNRAEISQLLGQKELLLKEVHHRIKNNMNTVCSLIELQGAEIEDDNSRQVLKNAGNRVRSMFHLYNRLYQSDDFQEASAGSYFPPLIDDIMKNVSCGRDDISLNLDIDDFRIGSRRIYNIGIIINELITNSVKYAFEGTEKPEISVAIRKEEYSIIISVKDNGRGQKVEPEKPGSGGFGMRLVENLVSDLNAELQIDCENGTETVIRIPLTEPAPSPAGT